MSSSSGISKLPRDVRNILRSSILVNSVPQCVEELVLNSIDAKASCIAIRVDLLYFHITVVDNGQGLIPENLHRVGSRHYTSKCHSLEELQNAITSYGFRGEALASIASCSAIVDVTSRPKNAKKTYTKLITYGKPHDVREASSCRPAHGTTVSVQDFLYNLPVRRNALNESLTLEEIRRCLEAISLVHPEISFSLRNDVNGEILLQTRTSTTMLDSFRHLFGAPIAQTLLPVNSTHPESKFEVSGFISSESHHTKLLQFLYVNKRLVLHTKMHQLVNKILKKSSICRIGSKGSFNSTIRLTGSPTKRGEKYPRFVIDITCPPSTYDITYEPRKTQIEFKNWDLVTNFLENSLNEFLSVNEFISKKAEEDLASGIVSKQTHEVENLVPKTAVSIIEPSNIRQSVVTRRKFTEIKEKRPKIAYKTCNSKKPCTEAIHPPVKDQKASDTHAKLPENPNEKILDKFQRNSFSNRFDESINYLSPIGKAVSMRGGGSMLKKFKLARALRTQAQFGGLSTRFIESSAKESISSGSPMPNLIQNPGNPSCSIELLEEVSEENVEIIRNHAQSTHSSQDDKGSQDGDKTVVNDEDSETEKMESQESSAASTSVSLGKHYYSSADVLDVETLRGEEVPALAREDISITVARSQHTPQHPYIPCGTDFFESRTPESQSAGSSAIRKPDSSPDTFRPPMEVVEVDIHYTKDISLSPEQINPNETQVEICEMEVENQPKDVEAEKGPGEPQLPPFECEMNEANSLAPLSSAEDDAVMRNREIVGNECKYRWIQSFDATNEPVYVNAYTGEIRREIPFLSKASVVNISSLPCLPSRLKQLMQHFTQEYSRPLKASLAMEDETEKENMLNLVQDYVEAMERDRTAEMKWRNPDEAKDNRFQRPFSPGRSLNPVQLAPFVSPVDHYKFDREIFRQFRVVGQADNKFIACLVSGAPLTFSNLHSIAHPNSGLNLLVLFDQHAVHERIRLEKLMTDNSELDPIARNSLVVKSVPLIPPVALDLSPEETRLMRIYGPKLERFGLVCQLTSEEEESVIVSRMPACFVARETSKVRHGRSSAYLPLIVDMIREELGFLKETGGALRSGFPNVVRNVLNSLACRGAVKFGDPLSNEECQHLIQSLQSCDLPFQCAHGRPVIAPIIALSQLENLISPSDQPSKRLNFASLKQRRR